MGLAVRRACGARGEFTRRSTYRSLLAGRQAGEVTHVSDDPVGASAPGGTHRLRSPIGWERFARAGDRHFRVMGGDEAE